MRKIPLIIAAFLMIASLPVYAFFCSNCGTELPDSANFCSGCGQTVSNSTNTTTTTYVTPSNNTVTYTTTTKNGVVTTTTSGTNTVIYTQPSVIVKPVPVPPQPSPVVKLVDGILSYQRWRHKAQQSHHYIKPVPAPGPRIEPHRPPKGPNPAPAPTNPGQVHSLLPAYL